MSSFKLNLPLPSIDICHFTRLAFLAYFSFFLYNEHKGIWTRELGTLRLPRRRHNSETLHPSFKYARSLLTIKTLITTTLKTTSTLRRLQRGIDDKEDDGDIGNVKQFVWLIDVLCKRRFSVVWNAALLCFTKVLNFRNVTLTLKLISTNVGIIKWCSSIEIVSLMN